MSGCIYKAHSSIHLQSYRVEIEVSEPKRNLETDSETKVKEEESIEDLCLMSQTLSLEKGTRNLSFPIYLFNHHQSKSFRGATAYDKNSVALDLRE